MFLILFKEVQEDKAWREIPALRGDYTHVAYTLTLGPLPCKGIAHI